MEAQLYNATKNVPDYTDCATTLNICQPENVGMSLDSVGGDVQTDATTPNRGGTQSASWDGGDP